MPKIIYFLVGLLGISFIIGIHELGHFAMCRAYGVAVPDFSIGFGPTLASIKTSQTRFSLSLIPLGGYVEILGVRAPEPGFENVSFVTKPLNKKIIILLGGIIANILTAFVLLFLVPSRRRKKGPPNNQEQTPQEPAGSPEQEPSPDAGTDTTGTGIIGPIGIIALITRSAEYGVNTYLRFLGILSLSLAIFNLFPIPALDGGQLVLTVLEHLVGGPLDRLWYNLIMIIGTVPLVWLFLTAMRGDIRRLIGR